jgi:CheY-like chemotaxis protein
MNEKKKILVIDDEESLCRSVKLNLEDTGRFEVRTETRGIMGLSAAKEFKPDLIILDFVMPDLDGSDVAYQIRSDNSTRDIPIIFLTAIATKADTTFHGDVIGGNYVVAKPVTKAKLIEAIESKIGR